MPANVETMAYRFADRSDTPWHGLGVPVPRNEVVSTKEFQKRAGAAWTAEKYPLWVRASAATPFDEHIKTDQFALLRSDNQFQLNIVSQQYKPVQNDEVFNFFSDFCTAGDMDIETGGVLDYGRTVWCLASIREGFTLAGGDAVEGFALFFNRHDGSAGGIKFTPIRVVCANTLAQALRDSTALNTFRIHHKQKFDAEKAKDALGLGHRQLEEFKEQAEFLVSRPMGDLAYTQFIDRLFPIKMGAVEDVWDASEGQVVSRPTMVRPRNYDRAVEALARQTCVEANRGTWWNGYNAITYMVDHMNPATDKSRALNSSLFGTGEKLKVQALNTALEMAR